jgi:acyl transferase domain-containing protein
MAVAYYRGVSCALYHLPGAMMAVGLGTDKVKPFLTNEPDVVIACHNSPESVTLSGGVAAIDKIQTALIEAGIFARKLNSSGNAYHSHLVKAAGQHYEDSFWGSLPDLAKSSDKLRMVPMYSCIDGKVLQSDQVGIKYWRRNLESPVLFDKAVNILLKSHPEVTHIVEIGVHSALAGPIKQIRSAMGIDAERLTYLPSLIRGGDGVKNMLHLAGTLFIHGYAVSIDRINARQIIDPSQPRNLKYDMGAHMIGLPTYQWDHSSVMWNECRWSRELRFRKHGRHDLLGSREPGGSLNEPLWRNRLSFQHVPWLQDHKVACIDIHFVSCANRSKDWERRDLPCRWLYGHGDGSCYTSLRKPQCCV